MARSDLFLISNYVHLGGEEYMTLILMTANAAGLFLPCFAVAEFPGIGGFFWFSLKKKTPQK